jgi:O-antigen ligase
MSPGRAAAGFERGGRAAAIALGAAIPVSVALDNILLLVLLACWIAGGSWGDKWATLRDHPIARLALLLAAAIFAGLIWVDPGVEGAGKTALKYLDLLFIPLLLHYFRDAQIRRLALMAFAGVTLLILMLSFMVKIGILSSGDVISGTTHSPVVFKFRITHNFLMAFGALVFAWFAMADPAGRRIRLIWALLALLAAANVLFMVEGATGQLVLAVLALWLAVARLPGRMRLLALLAAPAVAAMLVVVPGPITQRMAQLQQELAQWQPGIGQRNSSAGLRLEFFHNTAAIIADNPLLGVGTGGFAAAYAAKVRGTDMLATANPHNEYLMIAAQTGLLGLGLLLALFAGQWFYAARLPTPMEAGLARGLVIAMTLGCLFNSFLLDHAEGLFFAWMSGLLFAGYRADATTGRRA